MKYKVGDKVKVRTGLEGCNYYGGLYFATGMKNFCGKTFTIEKICSSDTYAVLETDWLWNDEMFEDLDRPKKFTSEVMFK